ncbi:MAG: glycosyltransferase [Ruminiclostridium sp.]|nr:glycosyltransferase [Ruminiclostridium sp.]
MKLTIGMIVKNEEKWLDKCLSAIKPILDNVDSELIITDTGSTDRTVEIAEKFTEKILHFEWIKDFSAARNTAFQVASGEWFMFLDADEIFESCDGIINFFNSGEYRKYKSASYVIRNLYGENEYTDFYPRRMVRRYPDTKFVGMIHEYLYPILAPSKHIFDVALHYGYVYETFEESKAKFERNIELMLKTLEVEDDPHPKIYSQLFDGYGSVYDFENANKYLAIGIEACRKNNDPYIVVLYSQKAEQLYRNGDYEKTYEVCEEYFDEKKRMKLPAFTTDGDMYAYKADSLFAAGSCEEAIPVYKKYFDTYRDIRSGKLNTEDMHQKTIEMCSEKTVPGLFNNFIACCINSGKYNTADLYFTTYPFNEYFYNDKSLVTLCSRMITVLERLEYNNIDKYFNKLDEKGRDLFIEMLFVRWYTTQGNDLITVALGKIVSGENKRRFDFSVKYFNGDTARETLDNAIVQTVICGNHSLGLQRANCGRLFIYEPVRCIEEIASVGSILIRENFPDAINIERAAAILSKCVQLKNGGNIKECISEMKKAVKEYEPIATIVSEYCSRMLADLEKERPVSEMDRLAAMIKSNINAMIKNGDLGNAQKTLKEYKSINPSDPEIQQIEKLLS